jgi:uncharacterized protein (TIGR00299 family) protein
MRLLYLDCIGGIAGDMTLAALIEAGVPEAELLDALRTLPISGWQWRSERVEVEAIFARRVYITHDEDQPHRHLSDVLEIIERGDFSARVKQQASAVFMRLAAAEAAVHGTTPDRVHFHEVGAVDAILDVVGACWGLERLEVERVVCSPLPMGRGFVQAAHGSLPLPAPAVVELLRGVPTYGIPIQGETVTPTGAALAVALSERFGVQPPMRWERIGYGAGHADRPLPNLLRVFVGESADATQTPAGDWESIVQIETHSGRRHPAAVGLRDGARAGDGRARCVFHAHPDEEEPPRRADYAAGVARAGRRADAPAAGGDADAGRALQPDEPPLPATRDTDRADGVWRGAGQVRAGR